MAGLVSAATFLVYLPVLQNRFIYWDDQKYVYENPHIRSFNVSFLKWAFLGFHSASVGNWLPLTWISYALDYTVWRLNPAGYHLTNIILHSANTFLVVIISVRLIGALEDISGRKANFTGGARLMVGVSTGLLFGLHPLHVESVAWVSERKDVLCGLFFLLSILAYLSYVARLNGPSRPEKSHCTSRFYLFSLAFFSLALMSKPMAVSLPLALLILDWHPLGRISSFNSFRVAFTEKLPFLIFGGCTSVLAVIAQKKDGTIMSLGRIPFSWRSLVSAKSLTCYLLKMVLPVDLVPYYPYPEHVSFLYARFFLPVACTVLITAFCVAVAKRQRLWLACWCYFIITLLPVLGLVQIGEQSMADRYTYLPSIGPFFAAAVAAAWAWKKAGTLKWERGLKLAGGSAAILVTLSMSYLTFRQIGIWKNSITFWNYVIKKEPGRLPIAYENLGVSLEDAGQIRKAITDYRKAASLAPLFFEAHYNLARGFTETGKLDLAISEYEKVIALNPSYANAYNDRGVVFTQMGRLDMALKDFGKAILLNHENAEFYMNRGKVYTMSGNSESAAADFRKACGMGDMDGCQAFKQFDAR